MDTARDFAGGVEALDRVAADVKNLSLVVDFETAHGVVHARPETDGEEGAFDVGHGVLEHHAVEVRILLILDVAVEGVVRLLEGVERDLQIVGHGLEVRIDLDDAVLDGAVIEFLRHVLADDRRFGVLQRRVDDGGVTHGDDGVGADLAVAGFLDEALGGDRIDHRTVAEGGFNEERSETEALFVGRGPRPHLDPVHLNGVGTDHLGFLNHFARGARMVRGVELFVEARVVRHAHLDVVREAARSEEDTLRGADVRDLAGLFTAVAIVDAGLDAEDAVVFVNDDFVDDRAQTRFDAVFLELGEHRVDEAGAGVVRHGVGALDGVTAVEGDGLELDADLVAEPIEVFDGFVGDAAGERRMSETAAGLDDVGEEQVGVVLDAFGLLHVGAGRGDGAAVDDGIAAGGGHLVDDHDFIGLHAEAVGFQSGGEAGKARTDDEEARGFVPLGGNLRARERGDGRTGESGRAERGAAEEGTTGKNRHVCLLLR